MDCLYNHISQMKRPSDWAGSIIPIGDLEKSWTCAHVRIVVPDMGDDGVKFVQKYLLRTISLLVYVRSSDARSTILELTQSQTHFDESLHAVELDDNFILRDKRDYFLDTRIFFTAPVLTEGEDITLESGQKMPLVRTEGGRLGYGQNGDVLGYMIPPGHLKRNNEDSNTEEVLVAVKTLSKNLPAAKLESKILAQLRNLLLDKPIQICTCLTMITDEKNIHSLSFRATGNLREKYEILKSHDEEPVDGDWFKSCMRQIRGLAEALEFLHHQESKGKGSCFCHMDIKPENILVFERDSSDIGIVGTWKLIDFGITTMSVKKFSLTDGGARNKGSEQRITITVGTTPRTIASRYQPPEINLNRTEWEMGKARKMGRGSDVWSLACVFAEVLAANLGQLNTLEDRIKGNEYFYRKDKNVPVCLKRFRDKGYTRHGYFDEWLKVLEKRGKSEPSLKVCHELIHQMTYIQRIRRMKSEQVVKYMNKLF
ncbi:kinase-like domain-containing protein [Annulohypoxylon nitens]|nr:kinase-like domain-containing protein [Annulohypoxylon nitens]